MPFSLLDRHVLTEWLKMLALTLSVVVGLLLLADVQNRLADLLAYGAGGRDVLRYYLILLPTFLPTVLPFSILISLVVSFGLMHRRLEIVAMRNAGLSIWRITRWVWFLGLVVAGGLFWLNANFVPWAKESSRELWNSFYFQGQLAAEVGADEIGVVRNLTFNNPEEGRMWFINRFSEYDYQAYGLSVSLFNDDGREVTRLVANRGYYDDTLGYWVLLEGREVSFDPEEGDAIRNLRFERREMTALDDDPVLMQFLKKKPQDLSFWQLMRVRESLERSGDPAARKYATRYFRILVNPLDVLIALALAIRFAIGPMRANPMLGVVKAIGLFLLYFILAQAVGLIGGAALAPWLAAFLPAVAMVCLALFLLSRVGNPQ